MGIRTKVILFLLGFGFVILATLLWSNQFVLHKTMLHYVDQRDQQRLERLQTNLQIFLQYEPISKASEIPEAQWRKLLHLSHRVDLNQMPSMIPLVIREPRRRSPPPDEFERRVSLLSPDGQLIYGPKTDKACHKLPVFIGDQPVALIAYAPLQELIQQADIEYAQSQLRVLTIGSVLITVLALILLWPLANHFLTPIRQLNQAMHRLASGDLTGRLNVQRKDEFGALQRDFNYLAKTLEAAQHSRNQWVADISHELRTPLTVLNGSIEAMSDGIRPMNAENLQKLQQEVSVLQRLIEDLYQLSLSDVGALQYSMEKLDWSALVTQVVASMQDKARHKGLVLHTEIAADVWIHGDRNRLTQLLSNVLKNSIDYTDAVQPNGEAGVVEVRLMENTENDTWVMEINGSSPSVTQPELQQLTQRFYRTEPSRNRRTGGAGLGLAMVSQIVQAHAGTILLTQSELGGLSVKITFAKLTD